MNHTSCNIKTIAFVTFLFIFSACDPGKQLRNLNEAAENTKAMRNSTDRLGKTSDELNEKTSLLGDKMSQLQATTEDAINKVRAATVALRGPCLHDAMGADFQEMVMKTACYFQAFEYQLWGGLSTDTVQRRDDLILNATEEFEYILPSYDSTGIGSEDQNPFFGNVLLEFLGWRELPEVLKINPGLAKQMVFFAMASTLHRTRREAVDAINTYNLAHPSDPPLKPVNMLSLIYSALRNEVLFNQGKLSLKDFPESERRLLSFKLSLIRILKARVVALASVGLIYTLRAPYQSKFEGAFSLDNFKELSGPPENFSRKDIAKKWQPDYYTPGVGPIGQHLQWLNYAIETQQFLNELCKPALFSGISRNLIRGATYTPPPAYVENKEMIDLIEEFQKRLNFLRSITPSLQ
jgi:hypothetical protein